MKSYNVWSLVNSEWVLLPQNAERFSNRTAALEKYQGQNGQQRNGCIKVRLA